MNLTLVAILVYLAIVNGAGIFLMGQDKFSARKNKNQERRIPEGLLFFLAIIGGSIGVYAGMFLFRHKTQKVYFLLGLPILLAQQIFIISSFAPLFFVGSR